MIVGLSTVALLNDKECDSIKNHSHGVIFLIRDFIQAYGVVDLELEKGGSCGNVISLAN